MFLLLLTYAAFSCIIYIYFTKFNTFGGYDMTGITQVLGAGTTSTIVGAVVLPNTGGNSIITIASALAAGLVTWGTLYAFNNR